MFDEESKAVQEVGKAVQETAKTVSNGLDKAEKFGAFVARYIGRPLETGIGIFHDKLTYFRWENQLRLMKRAQEFSESLGMTGPTRALPINFTVALIQAASEADSDMQDQFAALLVHSADAESDVEIRRTYIDTLERLTPLDALVLNAIYSVPYELWAHQGLLTAGLPTKAEIVPEKPPESFAAPSDEVLLSLANLAALGLLRPAATWGGGENLGRVNPTLFGRAFSDAVRRPRKRT